ncbi:MAG: hypothetical protein EZS28_046779 [Streblomastix strix]|uniref:Uncharacterized protein n=1 Tax=Streblomastix strix TaxID=222440 RepID=A0A5J4TJQ1_9EUKA|nr:MAG: hypothetical protein EZS28_046779 [Streblomastix strix]
MQVKDKIKVYEEGKKAARTLTQAQQTKLLLEARGGGQTKPNRVLKRHVKQNSDEEADDEQEDYHLNIERYKLKDHEDIKVQKFIIDTIWRCVDSRKKGEDFIFNSDNYIKLWALITQEEEKDIEVVMEEPLMRYNSCTSKKYKKKEIVRVDDVLIKNVSISNIDNVLWNSIEKLYRVNKDFVRLSDKLESDIGPDDF